MPELMNFRNIYRILNNRRFRAFYALMSLYFVQLSVYFLHQRAFEKKDIIDAIYITLDRAFWIITDPLAIMVVTFGMIYTLSTGVVDILEETRLSAEESALRIRSNQFELANAIVADIEPIILISTRTILMTNTFRIYMHINYAYLSLVEYSNWINRLAYSDMIMETYDDTSQIKYHTVINKIDEIYYVSNNQNDRFLDLNPDIPRPITDDRLDIMESMRTIDRERSEPTIVGHRALRDQLEAHLKAIVQRYNGQAAEILNLGIELTAKYEGLRDRLSETERRQ